MNIRTSASSVRVVRTGSRVGIRLVATSGSLVPFAETLRVTAKRGAYQKARRLTAEQVREHDESRAPEVACAHTDRAAAECSAAVGAPSRRGPGDSRLPLGGSGRT